MGQIKLERVGFFVQAVNPRIHAVDVAAGIMDRPPEGRAFIAVPVAVGVFEGDLREVRFGQPQFKRNFAAIQRQRVAGQCIRKLLGGDVSAGTGIPGAEVLKMETEKAEVLADQAEADTVIVIVENGVSIQCEGGFFCDQVFVMQIFDAAEKARVEPLPLNRLVRIARSQQAAGGKFNPIFTGVGVAFKPLRRCDRVTRPRRLCAEDNQRRSDDIPAEAGFPPAGAKRF